jgi:hypothetical protein
MRALAVDPGLSGGLAYDGRAVKMPPTEPDVVQAIKCINPDVVYMEDLPLGGFKTNPSAMAKLHGNAGVIRGAIMAMGVPLCLVKPKVWQKHFGLDRGTRTPTEWKNHLKAEAMRLFPKQDVTLATADALLIYSYACERLSLSAKT